MTKLLTLLATLFLSSNALALMDYEGRVYATDCQNGWGVMFRSDNNGKTIRYLAGKGAKPDMLRYQDTSSKTKVADDIWQYTFMQSNGDSDIWYWYTGGKQARLIQRSRDGQTLVSNGKSVEGDTPTLTVCTVSTPVYGIVDAYVGNMEKGIPFETAQMASTKPNWKRIVYDGVPELFFNQNFTKPSGGGYLVETMTNYKGLLELNPNARASLIQESVVNCTNQTIQIYTNYSYKKYYGNGPAEQLPGGGLVTMAQANDQAKAIIRNFCR
ncbi:hypothetical protein [Polynucleobacter sp. AP-Kolm-20A-A1]|uniref:hypothetical protein n=1 Tax=Polynucleobacter sp. AP-Kolm-20A-A1 TaxID=2081041 RepID=UPI001BFDB06F|nr:hypothetical protein [Polynucleobacter sp. AP-Kolm-20A-A1]